MLRDENHFNNASDPSILDDVRSLILRDRNHPSVIMWSICNEGNIFFKKKKNIILKSILKKWNFKIYKLKCYVIILMQLLLKLLKT